MKRSAALEPLSHDHHAGLAFVARLRKAQRDGADPAPLAAEVAVFWREHLVPHFEEEKAFVLPALERGAPELADRVLDEHRRLRSLAKRAGGEPASWDAPAAFADALAAHVRFEEREAFPAAERLALDLDRLGERIREAHDSRPPNP